MVRIKSEQGGSNNNVVTMLNDTKGFCCLDLKCSAMFCFTTFCKICIVFVD